MTVCFGWPPPNGHQQGVQGQLTIHSRPHRPSDDLARKQVENGSQVQPTLMRADVRYVRDPDLVWLSHVELALENVRRHYGWNAAAFESALAVPRLRAQAGSAHDPVNAIDAALLAQVAQVVGHFAVAVLRAAFQPRLLDMAKQSPIFDGPLAFRFGTPSIKTAGMHLAFPHRRDHGYLPLHADLSSACRSSRSKQKIPFCLARERDRTSRLILELHTRQPAPARFRQQVVQPARGLVIA